MKKIILLIAFVFLITVSCDDEFEINLGNEIANPANFQVDFDGETFVADIATATIYNGVTTIKAARHATNEVITIRLNKDDVGEYHFVPNLNTGEISYQVLHEDPFVTSKIVTSGRVDVTAINNTSKLIDGTFSCLSSRFVQQFDTLGNAVIDAENKLIFDTQSKDFSNGVFNNIVFTNTDNSVATVNQFFVKKDVTNNGLADGEPYVEDIIVARKETLGTQSYITIMAKKQDFENIMFRIPSGVNAGDNLQIDDVIITSSEVLGTYTFDKDNYYLAVNQDADIIHITKHNFVSKTLEATFSFDVIHPITGEIIHFTDGDFSVVYTDD